ncbi:MAG: putative colanic acid biosynthesis acetyltransferase [bacterium]|mgnify:FL=1
MINLGRRLLWELVWAVAFRPTPVPLFGWRRFLLRLFGARIGRGSHVYPSVRIWAPWNLTMGDRSCLGRWVDCYSVERIILGDDATVSQYSFLCSASHDIQDKELRLVASPIGIGSHAWVAADAFVGPGVTIGEGAVVGARACVFKSVAPWTVVGGNPARFLKRRKLRKSRG